LLRGGWVREAIDTARNCTGCGACLERCPYELPIPDLIRENLEWVEDQLEAQP
jgi:predicted aldo/keto reductase-like oxidoreductase